jgi:hypothetical protein
MGRAVRLRWLRRVRAAHRKFVRDQIRAITGNRHHGSFGPKGFGFRCRPGELSGCRWRGLVVTW